MYKGGKFTLVVLFVCSKQGVLRFVLLRASYVVIISYIAFSFHYLIDQISKVKKRTLKCKLQNQKNCKDQTMIPCA